MQTIKVNPQSPDLKLIAQAAKTIENGGLVVCPTDTVYIFAVDATNEEAIRKVYEIKGRDYSKPIHVVVRGWEMVKNLCEVNEVAMKLYNEFLPGPLTIILNKKPIVPDILSANLPTLGIRLPNNPTTRAISANLDFPYTATSANKSGESNTYTANDVLEQLTQQDLSLIDLVIDAGELPKVDPSTVVDCTTDTPRILRPGPITQGQIEAVLNLNL